MNESAILFLSPSPTPERTETSKRRKKTFHNQPVSSFSSAISLVIFIFHFPFFTFHDIAYRGRFFGFILFVFDRFLVLGSSLEPNCELPLSALCSILHTLACSICFLTLCDNCKEQGSEPNAITEKYCATHTESASSKGCSGNVPY